MIPQEPMQSQDIGVTDEGHGMTLALIQTFAIRGDLLEKNPTYKGRSTLVSIVPKITARWRQMEFCIFCAKSRQNERSSVVCSLNVSKLSRDFS